MSELRPCCNSYPGRSHEAGCFMQGAKATGGTTPWEEQARASIVQQQAHDSQRAHASRRTQHVPPSLGWLCIRCGRSYAPFVSECDACNEQEAQP